MNFSSLHRFNRFQKSQTIPPARRKANFTISLCRNQKESYILPLYNGTEQMSLSQNKEGGHEEKVWDRSKLKMQQGQEHMLCPVSWVWWGLYEDMSSDELCMPGSCVYVICSMTLSFSLASLVACSSLGETEFMAPLTFGILPFNLVHHFMLSLT